jgi:hypothetical protein
MMNPKILAPERRKRKKERRNIPEGPADPSGHTKSMFLLHLVISFNMQEMEISTDCQKR